MTSINDYSEFTVKQRKNCSCVQFFTLRRPMRSFSSGAVAIIALWKSTPDPECHLQQQRAATKGG